MLAEANPVLLQRAGADRIQVEQACGLEGTMKQIDDLVLAVFERGCR